MKERLEQLNEHSEGPALTAAEIRAQYKEYYKPDPTPFTHPELFDPFNPPEGYLYDAWHAIWHKTPTETEYRFNVFLVWLGVAVVVGYVIWALAKVAW